LETKLVLDVGVWKERARTPFGADPRGAARINTSQPVGETLDPGTTGRSRAFAVNVRSVAFRLWNGGMKRTQTRD